MVQSTLKDARRLIFAVHLLFHNLSEFTEQQTLHIFISQTQCRLCTEGIMIEAGRAWLVSPDPENFRGINHDILFYFETSCL